MTIRLSPELEAAVERGVSSGRYGSAEEFLAKAAKLLQERGEFIPLEEARRRFDTSKAEWRADRPLAARNVKKALRPFGS